MRRPSLRLVVVALIGLTVACVRTPPPAPAGAKPAAFALPQRIRVRTNGVVLSVPLEEYVLGTALAEVAPVGENPATTRTIFETQAILARTYAVSHLGRHASEGFDLCDGTHCQVYDPSRITRSRFAAVARAAVAATTGEVLMFSGRPAEALFHSDCGGHTAAAGDVWGGAPVPYLVGAPDEIPNFVHHAWHVDVSVDAMRRALGLDPRSDPGRTLSALSVVARDESGRVERIDVRGEQEHILRGEDVRAILNRTLGDRGIQSTRFTVRRQGAGYHFDGTGYGHGVGLCQVGAAARARRGEPVEQILSDYFPGAHLKPVR